MLACHSAYSLHPHSQQSKPGLAPVQLASLAAFVALRQSRPAFARTQSKTILWIPNGTLVIPSAPLPCPLPCTDCARLKNMGDMYIPSLSITARAQDTLGDTQQAGNERCVTMP